ncbi:MAG: hypothetical protein AMXMBFR7_17010 [Planctomycetota bacterium]
MPFEPDAPEADAPRKAGAKVWLLLFAMFLIGVVLPGWFAYTSSIEQGRLMEQYAREVEEQAQMLEEQVRREELALAAEQRLSEEAARTPEPARPAPAAPSAEEQPSTPERPPAFEPPPAPPRHEAEAKHDAQGLRYVEVRCAPRPADLGAGLRQLAVAANGKQVFARHEGQARVRLFDAATLAPAGEIVTPRFPDHLWCEGAEVAVCCGESKVLVFADPAAQELKRSVTFKQDGEPLVPVRVFGRTPGGELMLRLHHETHDADYLYHLRGDGTYERKMRAASENAVWLTDPLRILTQSSFRGSPCGAPDVRDETGRNLRLEEAPALGPRANWHRDTGRIFALARGRHLALPTTRHAEPHELITYLLTPDLQRLAQTLPGAAFAEWPERGLVIAWRPDPDEKKRDAIQILYVSRSTGRIVRIVQPEKAYVHPTQFLRCAGMGGIVFVPEGERVLFFEPHRGEAEQKVLAIPCGLPDGLQDEPADPFLTLKNSPPTRANVNAPYRFDPRFENEPAGMAIVFKLAAGPKGVQVDAATGSVTWLPSAAYLGRYDLALVAVLPNRQEIPLAQWVLEVKP